MYVKSPLKAGFFYALLFVISNEEKNLLRT